MAQGLLIVEVGLELAAFPVQMHQGAEQLIVGIATFLRAPALRDGNVGELFGEQQPGEHPGGEHQQDAPARAAPVTVYVKAQGRIGRRFRSEPADCPCGTAARIS